MKTKNIVYFCSHLVHVAGVINNNIEFEYVDVDLCSDNDKELAGQDISKLGGRFSFPTIIIDDKNLITGFKEEEIKQLLEI